MNMRIGKPWGDEAAGCLEPGGSAAGLGLLETAPLSGLFEYDL